MEKFANGRRKFRRGLLAAAMLFFGAAAAQNENLYFLPSGQIFAKQVSRFGLFIRGAKSSSVRFELPALPEGVSFDSSRIRDFNLLEYGVRVRGVQIELNLIFEEEKNFSLPPVLVFVGEKKYSAKFEEIEVFENPATVLPRLFVLFDDGTEIFEQANSKKKSAKNAKKIFSPLGSSVFFTIYVQYAKSIQNVFWDIPKNSIFRQTKKFDFAQKSNESESGDVFENGEEKKFAGGGSEKNVLENQAAAGGGSENPSEAFLKPHEKIPLCRFEWISFEKGDADFPDIFVSAVTLSGKTQNVKVPKCQVHFFSQDEKEKNAADFKNGGGIENFFGTEGEKKFLEQAFFSEIKNEVPLENNFSSIEQLVQIASLRSKERNSFFQNKIRSKRILEEKKFGIENSKNEKSLPQFFLILAAAFLILIFGVGRFFFKKKNPLIFVFAFLTLAFFSAAFFRDAFFLHGVVLEESVFSVPENSALAKTQIPLALRVRILQKIDNWFLVEYNDVCGWMKKESLAEIK